MNKMVGKPMVGRVNGRAKTYPVNPVHPVLRFDLLNLRHRPMTLLSRFNSSTTTPIAGFDRDGREWDKPCVKAAKKVLEKKTPGTLIVEKYRPRLNKLTLAERQQLRNRAMHLAFGHESESAPTRRR